MKRQYAKTGTVKFKHALGYILEIDGGGLYLIHLHRSNTNKKLCYLVLERDHTTFPAQGWVYASDKIYYWV